MPRASALCCGTTSSWERSPNLAEMYRAKVEDLSQLLVVPQHKAEAFDIIRGLIDEVRIVPEKGELRIDLRGELAGILNLCDSKKMPASSYDERAKQIKMVAGARNNLYRTVLIFTARGGFGG